MKHLATFDAAAQSLGIDPTKLPDVTGLPEADGKAVVSAYKLFIISRASWQGKKIDWSNSRQYKYYPWFDMETYPWFNAVGSGAGFSFGGGVCVRSHSTVGSRLCYPNSETAAYVGKTHLALYRDVMVIE